MRIKFIALWTVLLFLSAQAVPAEPLQTDEGVADYYMMQTVSSGTEKDDSGTIFRKFFQPAPPNGSRRPPDILQNLLFVNGDNGSGTAFKMQFGQLPVIISNAHVFLGLLDPVIRDIHGRPYRILSAFGVKERDLVILTYLRNGREAPLLRPEKNLSALRAETPVTAYGNSQGSQTHSVLPGILLGLGYDRMEISCGIVGGNSGGPVLLDGAGTVVGVSTFLTIRKVEPQTHGTRYGRTDYQDYNVRRFATRIDNLTPDMLESLNIERLEKERHFYVLSENIQKELNELIRQKDADKVKSCLDSYSEELLLIDEYQWMSSFLKKEYFKKHVFLGILYQKLAGKNLILAARLRNIWRQTPFEVKKGDAMAPEACPHCKGFGRILEPDRYSISGIARSRVCPVCSGSGQIENPGRERSGPQVEYLLPASYAAAFRKCILKAEHPFNGFFPGGDLDEEQNRFSYYNTYAKLYSVQRRGLERIHVYRGNHRISNAVKTQLTFMFDRLVRVEVFVPYSEQAASYYVTLLRNNFNDMEDVFQVELSRSGQFLYLDCRHEAYLPLKELAAGGPQE